MLYPWLVGYGCASRLGYYARDQTRFHQRTGAARFFGSKNFLRSDEISFHDCGSDEECCNGGAKHKGDSFAELAPEFSVKDDRAIERKTRDQEDADRC